MDRFAAGHILRLDLLQRTVDGHTLSGFVAFCEKSVGHFDHLGPELGAEDAVDQDVEGGVYGQEQVAHVGQNVRPDRKRPHSSPAKER